MPDLKQSTATPRLIFMTDANDHVSGKTGLSLTIAASKAAGAFATITPAVTERDDGWYALALTAGHTDTLGDLALHVTGTGADPTDKLFNVVAGSLDADVSSRSTYAGTDTAGTTTLLGRLGVPAGASIAADLAEIEGETDAIGAAVAAIPTSNPDAAAVATAVWQDATAGDFTVNSSIGKVLSAFTFVGSNVNANVQVNSDSSVASATAVAAIRAKTDLIVPLDVTGTVDDLSPGAGSFKGSNALSGANSFYVGSYVAFTSGALQGLSRVVATYTGSTRLFAFSTAFPSAPANADAFVILGGSS